MDLRQGVRLSQARPWQPLPGGLAVSVRVTPKGGRDSIDGIERLSDGRSVLKVRVRAAASEGEANAAVIRLIAKSLDLATRDVCLLAGATARLKRLKINGSAVALAAALETMTASAGSAGKP